MYLIIYLLVCYKSTYKFPDLETEKSNYSLKIVCLPFSIYHFTQIKICQVFTRDNTFQLSKL